MQLASTRIDYPEHRTLSILRILPAPLNTGQQQVHNDFRKPAVET